MERFSSTGGDRNAGAFSLLAPREKLRGIITVLTSLMVLAWTSSTAGHSVLSVLKLLAIPLALFVAWLYALRFPRSNTPFPSWRSGRTHQAVMDRFLALALVEVLAGWGVFSASLVPFDPDTWTLALMAVGSGMIIDGSRRLLRRKPLPPGLA